MSSLLVLLFCSCSLHTRAVQDEVVVEHSAGPLGDAPEDCYITERKESYGIQFKIASFSCNFFRVFNSNKFSRADWTALVVEQTFSPKKVKTKAGQDVCACFHSDEVSHMFVPGKFAGEEKCDATACFKAYSALMYIAGRQTRGGYPGELHTISHWTVTKDGSGGTNVPLLEAEIEKLKENLSPESGKKLDKELKKAGAVRVDELVDVGELEIIDGSWSAEQTDEDNVIVVKPTVDVLVPEVKPTGAFVDPVLKPAGDVVVPVVKKDDDDVVVPAVKPHDHVHNGDDDVPAKAENPTESPGPKGDISHDEDPTPIPDDFNVEQFLADSADEDETEDEPMPNLGTARHNRAANTRNCQNVLKSIWTLNEEATRFDRKCTSCPASDALKSKLYSTITSNFNAHAYDKSLATSPASWNEACTNFGDFLSKDGQAGRTKRRRDILELLDAASAARSECKNCDVNELEYKTQAFGNTVLPAVLRRQKSDSSDIVVGTMDEWQEK